MRTSLILLAVAMLGACSPSAPELDNAESSSDPAAPSIATGPNASSEPDQHEPTVILRSDGLVVETPGRGVPLTFDETTQDQAENAFANLAPPKRSSNDECPAGPLDFMDWENGLQLIFQDGKLVGWWANDQARGVATASGLRPGAGRSDIGSAQVEDTSIGKVFTVDGVNGVLDEATATKVDALWGGVACIFH